MARIVAIVTLLVATPPMAAAAAVLPPPQAVRITTTETSERVALPRARGKIKLVVDAFSRKIILKPTIDSPSALQKQLAENMGALCPQSRVVDGAVELTCRNRRFDAELTVERGKQYLDINELRGIPWRAGPDGPISYHFEPWRSGLGQACPGVSEAARGECELKLGHRLEAALHFRAALETTGRQVACLRLGDLALEVGDPTVAMGWYRRVGGVGAFGRVAMARICEIDGSCLDSSESLWQVFKPDGLPEPLRAELLIRAVRAETYMGRAGSAIDILSRQVRAQGMNSICRETGELLCRRVLLAALTESAARADTHKKNGAKGRALPGERKEGDHADDTNRDEQLIELYLALPGWEKGPLALELAQAAAPVIARAGAPMFAGNLLSALAPEVPPSRLADHLLLSAETFLSGQAWARARLVVEYAESRLDKKTLASPRWARVIREVLGNGDLHEVSPEVRGAIETEMTATVTALKETRTVLNRAHSILSGLQDTEAGVATQTVARTDKADEADKAKPAETAAQAETAERGEKP